ncbi:MAG: phosphoribosylaminoimidazolesuccinocarboxamide synthase [Candidatus Uhrbacteria bacterium]|nr:phosphoribosylaminoimidazolesuccinocarboxamide synthase [Candidatus Uhrbacteria bacterium]
MTTIPFMVAEDRLSSEVLRKRLKRIHQGKVRDTYELPGHPDKLLVVATDRLSIFDFVLGYLIPRKGEILTAMTVFWLRQLFADLPHHLIACGPEMDTYLPSSLRSLPQLQKRALIVKKLQMLPIECIARGYLTGTGLKAYRVEGKICGHELPNGLHDGSKLVPALFTPTTKPTYGHDEHITAESVLLKYGEMPSRVTLEVYERAAEFALERGIIIADMKIELGIDGTLADEVITPDSCRFWDRNAYGIAVHKRTSPSGFDKEPVRQAGKKAIIDGKLIDLSSLDTTLLNAELASRWEIPRDVIGQTVERYHQIFIRLTGMSLPTFQERIMEID